MESALTRKEPLIEWVVQRKLAGWGGSDMGRQQAIEDLLPLLPHLPGPMLDRVAARLDTRTEALYERISELSDRLPSDRPPTPVDAWRPHVDASHILWLLVHRYEQTADLIVNIHPGTLGRHGIIMPVVARLLQGEPPVSVANEIENPAVQRTLRAVIARTEPLYEDHQAGIAMAQILNKLDKPRRLANLTRLTASLEHSLRDGQFERLKEAQSLRKRLVEVERVIEQAVREQDAANILHHLTTTTHFSFDF